MTIVSSPADMMTAGEAAAAHLPHPVRNNWVAYLQHASAVGQHAVNLRTRNQELGDAAAAVAGLETDLRIARDHLEQLQKTRDTETNEHDGLRVNAITYRELVELYCDQKHVPMPEEPMDMALLLSGAWQQLDQIREHT